MYSYELLARKDIGFYVHSKKYQAPLTSTVNLIYNMCNQTRQPLALQFSTEFLIQTPHKIVSLLYTFCLFGTGVHKFSKIREQSQNTR